MVKPMVFPPTLFGSLSYWASIFKQNEKIIDDLKAPFQRQSHQNRLVIAGPGGKQILSFPVEKSSLGGSIKNVKLSKKENWPIIHLRAVQTAYGSAPYFEHYFPFLESWYANPSPWLADWMEKSLAWNINQLQISVIHNFIPPVNFWSEKTQNPNLPAYFQGFSDKKGFISEVSLLDAWMHLGPETIPYLAEASSG